MPAPMIRVDTKLYQWCTVRQLEILQAIEQQKGRRAAAKALGVSKGTVDSALRFVEAKAAIHGYSPQHDLTRTIAPGQKLRGASTLYRRGEVGERNVHASEVYAPADSPDASIASIGADMNSPVPGTRSGYTLSRVCPGIT